MTGIHMIDVATRAGQDGFLRAPITHRPMRQTAVHGCGSCMMTRGIQRTGGAVTFTSKRALNLGESWRRATGFITDSVVIHLL